MIDYTPDRWLAIKIASKEDSHHRIFACWYGSFTTGDSWKMNSGISSVIEKDDYYDVTGDSGSIYRCYKDAYGISSYGDSVLSKFIREGAEEDVIIEIVPSEINLTELDKS